MWSQKIHGTLMIKIYNLNLRLNLSSDLKLAKLLNWLDINYCFNLNFKFKEKSLGWEDNIFLIKLHQKISNLETLALNLSFLFCYLS